MNKFSKLPASFMVLLVLGACSGAPGDKTVKQEKTVRRAKTLVDSYCGMLGAPPRTDACVKAAKEIHVEFGLGTVPQTGWHNEDGVLEIMHYDPGPPLSTDSAFTFTPEAGGANSFLVCFNSPSLLGNVMSKLESNIKNAPDVRGALLDSLWWGSFGRPEDWCVCEHCKKQFKEKFGKDLPVVARCDWASVDSLTMRQAIEWRRDSIREFYEKVYAGIKAIRPDITVIPHGIGAFFIDSGNFFAGLESLRSSDIAYWESYGDESFYAPLLRGLSRKPFMMHIYGSEFTTESWPSSHQFPMAYSSDYCSAVTSNIVANGGRPIQGFEWDNENGLSKDAVSLMEPIYRQVKEKQPYVQNAVPVTYAAIVYSNDTKLYYSRNDDEKSLMPNLRGALDLLQKLHVPVEFLCDLDLDLENLKKFQVVILPNAAVLTKPQLEAITRYVKEGGSILSTYETSLCDELGEKKGNFGLSEVFGLKYISTRSNAVDATNKGGACLAPADGLMTHIQAAFAPSKVYPLFMPGPSVESEPISGVTEATLSLNPGPGVISGRPSSIPAVHVNQFGKGKSAYVGTPIFRIYALAGSKMPIAQSPALPLRRIVFSRRGWITDLVRELVNHLAPNPPIKVEGRNYLECTFFEQKEQNRVIVHLLNSTVRELGEVYPIDPAKALIRKDFVKPRKVYVAWPKRKNLKVIDRGEYLEVSVPETRIHQILVVER